MWLCGGDIMVQEALAPLPESRDDTGGSDPEYATEEQRHATERARLSVLQKPTVRDRFRWCWTVCCLLTSYAAHVLSHQRLKDSLIWDLQRRFYSGHGVGVSRWAVWVATVGPPSPCF